MIIMIQKTFYIAQETEQNEQVIKGSLIAFEIESKLICLIKRNEKLILM